MMDNEVFIDDLREKYPGSFEGWDEFEAAISIRERKNCKPEMLVVLYNKGTDGFVVDTHASFLITSDENDQDVVRTGGVELVQEYYEAYIPESSK